MTIQMMIVSLKNPHEIERLIVKEFYVTVLYRGEEDNAAVLEAKRLSYGMSKKTAVILAESVAAAARFAEEYGDLPWCKIIVFGNAHSFKWRLSPHAWWVDQIPCQYNFRDNPIDENMFPIQLDRIALLGSEGRDFLIAVSRHKENGEDDEETELSEYFDDLAFQHRHSPDFCDEEILYLQAQVAEIDKEYSKTGCSLKTTGLSEELLSGKIIQSLCELYDYGYWHFRNENYMRESLWSKTKRLLKTLNLSTRDFRYLISITLLYQLDRTSKYLYNREMRDLTGTNHDGQQQVVLLRKWMDSPSGHALFDAYLDLFSLDAGLSWWDIGAKHNISSIDLYMLYCFQQPNSESASHYPHYLKGSIGVQFLQNLAHNSLPPLKPIEDFFT